MTTDTHPKEYAVSFSGDDLGFDGVTFTVGGMSKGSGMIMPNMATMIAIVTTDAPIAAAHLSQILRDAVGVSFNKITVDSDTSTNDTCVTLAGLRLRVRLPSSRELPPIVRSPPSIRKCARTSRA